MRTPFALRNLTHRKVRAVVALSGVCFSVLLVFMQAGFYSAVLSSATAVYRRMDADIFLTSTAYVFIAQSGTVPRERVRQAQAIDGVKGATAFYADVRMWRNPVSRNRNLMFVMAFDPASNLLDLPVELTRQLGNGQILIDSLTRPDYGPQDVGTITEIDDRQVRIAGQYRIGPGFNTDGAAITDEDTFIRLSKNRVIAKPNFVVVHLNPGADVNRVARALQAAMPADTRVVTRTQMIESEEDYWAVQTSIGPTFAAGGVLGLVIGIVILYQVMVTDIANHIREYATMKALGYPSGRLRWIVLQEVSVFSLVGFCVGWLLSLGVYKVVRDQTGLPMSMPLTRSMAVFAITLLMCWAAGLLSTRKLGKADPADLF